MNGDVVFCGCSDVSTKTIEVDGHSDFEEAHMIILSYGISIHFVLQVCYVVTNSLDTRSFNITNYVSTVGMILYDYIIEYGEYSDTINFTQILL